MRRDCLLDALSWPAVMNWGVRGGLDVSNRLELRRWAPRARPEQLVDAYLAGRTGINASVLGPIIAVQRGGWGSRTGALHRFCDPAVRTEIVERYQAGETQKSIAAAYGTCSSRISTICASAPPA